MKIVRIVEISRNYLTRIAGVIWQELLELTGSKNYKLFGAQRSKKRERAYTIKRMAGAAFVAKGKIENVVQEYLEEKGGDGKYRG